ncbi:hypothetical protein D3C79_614930 [compost metagenome]
MGQPGTVAIVIEQGAVGRWVRWVQDLPLAVACLGNLEGVAAQADVALAICQVMAIGIRFDPLQTNFTGVVVQRRLPQSLLTVWKPDLDQAIDRLARRDRLERPAGDAQPGDDGDVEADRLEVRPGFVQIASLPGMGPFDHLADQLRRSHCSHHGTERRDKERGGIEQVETDRLPVSETGAPGLVVDVSTRHRQGTGVILDLLHMAILQIAKQLLVDERLAHMQVGARVRPPPVQAIAIIDQVIQGILQPRQHMFLRRVRHIAAQQCLVGGLA